MSSNYSCTYKYGVLSLSDQKPLGRKRMTLGERLKVAFQQVDSSSDGRINLTELSECCNELQIELEDEDIKAFKSCEDENISGLNFDGFVRFIKLRLHRVFDEIDLDKSGFVDIHEIKHALTRLGIKCNERQVHSILMGMDSDGNNKIDFEEFCLFFSDIPSPSLQAIAKKWSLGDGLDFGSDIVPTTMPPSEMPLFQFMLAGGLAGVASRTFTAPLEKIKLLAQTSSSGRIKIGGTLRNIFINQGFTGLFSGNLTNCLRVFPTASLVCLVYSRMIKYTPVDNVKNPQQPLWRFLSGATAGIVSTTVTHPLDVVRARLTIQTKGATAYNGILNAFRRIHVEEGMRGLYKGLAPSLLSIAPFIGVQQTVYDITKLYALDSKFSANASTFLLCGAFAGMAAQTAVHPLDVVRRQMQVSRSSDTVMKSSLSALRHLLTTGGVQRIYAGLFVAYLKVIPAAASSLLVRDALLGRLES